MADLARLVGTLLIESLRRRWMALDRGWKAAVLGVLIVAVHLP